MPHFFPIESEIPSANINAQTPTNISVVKTKTAISNIGLPSFSLSDKALDFIRRCVSIAPHPFAFRRYPIGQSLCQSAGKFGTSSKSMNGKKLGWRNALARKAAPMSAEDFAAEMSAVTEISARNVFGRCRIWRVPFDSPVKINSLTLVCRL